MDQVGVKGCHMFPGGPVLGLWLAGCLPLVPAAEFVRITGPEGARPAQTVLLAYDYV